MQVNILFFIIFFSSGFILLFLSIIFKLFDKKMIDKCKNKVKGKVVKFTLWSNNGVSFPIVEYFVDGIKYTQRLKYGWIITKSSSFKKPEMKIVNNVTDKNLKLEKNSHFSINPLKKQFPIGTELDVYYDPGKPKRSFVMRYVNNPCIVVFLAVSIVFVLVSFIGLFLMPNNFI